MAFPDIADSKQCQTLINVAARAAEQVQQAAATLQACRSAYMAAEPDPSGTALEGNVSAVSGWIDGVVAAAESGVATQMIAAKRPHHREEY